ncbi:MAG: pyruvate kinase [Leptolyngbya sp. PLA2]|nr:pyruvate kinase [Leptolyngbya sp.]MCE7971732.1 pyruvate kinase [Leptolyngbya sp. PL-A2]MCZ7634373.1 pyruvate kinase [Phycisphaerales bacterium]MDL1904829.1 pyruvate kinase [Synechococcales cyanobacterium CNB]GIK19688.1 MAG: pyruvate kinase [Planctomycetota bacterium]
MPHEVESRPTLTKIIATLGPASESPEMVRALVESGASVFRLNFSHGSFDDHLRRLRAVRAVSETVGLPLAVFGDLPGPKIRVGRVPATGVVLHAGVDAVIRSDLEEARYESDRDGQRTVLLPCSYQPLAREVEVGHRVLINDGAIRMLAVEADPRGQWLRCRVTVGGLVTTGKGINLPDSDLSAPALTDRDLACVEWAVEHGLDFLALSFVRRADDVLDLKRRLGGMCPACKTEPGDEQGAAIPVIAKVEKPQAVEAIDAIADAADAIMVARGDLGVEMDLVRVPVVQKRIVAAAAEWGKPCIVATQMLETMIENATPTRAEASDVANAIFDGAGCLMLSGETAVGKRPDLAVDTMRRIALEAERHLAALPQRADPPRRLVEQRYRTAALAHGAWHVAHDCGAELVVCWSQAGGTARYLSQNEFSIPIVAYSSSLRATRRMALLRGVTPVCSPPPPSGRLADWNAQVDRDLLARGWAVRGTPVVLLAGKPLGCAKATNTIAFHRVGDQGGFLGHDA